MMCDTQIENDRRRIVFSSLVRVFNSTAFPLSVISVKSEERKKVARIDINKDYCIPIDLLYGDSESTIYIGIDE